MPVLIINCYYQSPSDLGASLTKSGPRGTNTPRRRDCSRALSNVATTSEPVTMTHINTLRNLVMVGMAKYKQASHDRELSYFSDFNMARRGGRRTRNRRRRYSSNSTSTFRMSIPFNGSVYEGKAVNISLQSFIKDDTIFKGVPWRLVSIKAQFAIQNIPVQAQGIIADIPALVQVSIHDAGLSNVENMVTQRIILKANPRTVIMRPRSPNLWKEDEQRTQALISIYNVPCGQEGDNSLLVFLIEGLFQFGKIPWTLPKSIFTIPPSDHDDNASTSSYADLP